MPTRPAYRFDYRTIRTDFAVWGWHFQLERDPVEFLNLYDVTCSGLTLQGSGVVTVSVPAACDTGKNQSSTFQVDLGPSMPADEHAMAGETGTYGNRVHVDLESL